MGLHGASEGKKTAREGYLDGRFAAARFDVARFGEPFDALGFAALRTGVLPMTPASTAAPSGAGYAAFAAARSSAVRSRPSSRMTSTCTRRCEGSASGFVIGVVYAQATRSPRRYGRFAAARFDAGLRGFVLAFAAPDGARSMTRFIVARPSAVGGG